MLVQILFVALLGVSAANEDGAEYFVSTFEDSDCRNERGTLRMKDNECLFLSEFMDQEVWANLVVGENVSTFLYRNFIVPSGASEETACIVQEVNNETVPVANCTVLAGQCSRCYGNVIRISQGAQLAMTGLGLVLTVFAAMMIA